MSTREEPKHPPEELDRVARVTSKFLTDIRPRRVAIVFTDMTDKDHDFPVVVTNTPMSSVECIFAATGLLGPLVNDDHPVKCVTVKSLLGPEQAIACSECGKRGQVPAVQQGIEAWEEFVSSGALESLLTRKGASQDGVREGKDTKVDRPIPRGTTERDGSG